MPSARTKQFLAFFVLGAVAVTVAMGFFWLSHVRTANNELALLLEGEMAAITDRPAFPLRLAASDLLMARNHPAVQRHVNNDDPAALDDIATQFVMLIRHRPEIDHIRLIDGEGMELVRVESTTDGIRIIPRSALQDKSDRDYFRVTRTLSEGSIFVSPPDLNREHHKIETPYRPVMRFAVPLRDRNGNPRGVLVSNLRIPTLLGVSRRMIERLGTGVALTEQGYWMKAPDPGIEWGHILGHGLRFGDRFPDEWMQIDASQGGGVLRTDHGLFAFRHFYPVAAIHQELADGDAVFSTEAVPLASGSMRWTFLIHRPAGSLPHLFNTFAVNYWIVYGILLATILYAALASSRILALRRSAYEERLRNEKRYRALVEASSQIVWRANDQAQVDAPSPSWLAFTGQSPAEMMGRGWMQAIHPDDLDRVVAESRENLARETIIDMEYRLKRHDGVWRQMWVRGVPVRDKTGQVVEIIGMCTDITERRKLRRDLALFKKMVETSSDPFYLVDLEDGGRLVYVNAAAIKHWGYDRETLLTMRIFDFDPAVTPEEMPAILQKSRDNPSRIFEARHRRANGEIVPVIVSASHIDIDGRHHSFGYVRDISEQKRAEAELMASEQRFRDFTETASDWVWEIDGDLRISFISQQSPTMRNGSAETILGRHPWELEELDPADLQSPAWIAHRDDLEHHRPFRNFHYRMRSADGQIRHQSISGLPHFDGNGMFQGYRGTGTDITQMVTMTADLQKAKEDAEAASRAKSEFLSSMSHELRTPLNAILGFAQLLQLDTGRALDETQQSSVEQILTAGDHLLRLIDEVLDLARIESGSFAATLEPLDPQDVIDSSLAAIRRHRDAHDKTIIDKSHEMALPRVIGGATQARQVLMNFLSNAIKYNRPNGHVVLSVEEATTGFLRFNVTDTGIGIDEDKVSRLFTPFDRLGHEKSSVEGTGIGLFICQRLVEEMNGRLGFCPAPGEGSTFWFELPIEQQPADGQAPALASKIDTRFHRRANPADLKLDRPRTILYVEDNRDNLRIIKELMEEIPGIRLLTADNAEEGLKLVAAQSPDLILMDINLPGMNGYQAVRHLKADPLTRHLPVIAVSARAMPEEIQDGASAGFDAYLTKPFRISDLFDEIRRFLAP